MDITTIVLAGFLLFCVIKLSIKPVRALVQYELVKSKVTPVPGEIIRVVEAGERKYKGVVEKEFFPVYRCEINGEEKLYHSFVKHISAGQEAIGQKVTLLYDGERDILWCERELPVMKKVVLIRFALILGLIGVMVFVNILTGNAGLI